MSQELGAGAYSPHASIAGAMEIGQSSSSDERPRSTSSPGHIVPDYDKSEAGRVFGGSATNNARVESDDVFLVWFIHIGCPDIKACNSWQAVDLQPIVRYLCRPFSAHEARSETALARRQREFQEVMYRAFAAGAGMALRCMHDPRRRSSRIEGHEMHWGSPPLDYALRDIMSIHIRWALVGEERTTSEDRIVEYQGFGLSADLYATDDVRTVQQQLELIRRRGFRDVIEVGFDADEYAAKQSLASESADIEESQEDAGGQGGGRGNNLISEQAGLSDRQQLYDDLRQSFDRHSDDGDHDDDGDAQMDSPPWYASTGRCPPSSPSDQEDGGMNTQVDTGYKGDILDLEPLRGLLYGNGRSSTPSLSPAGPSGQHQEEEQEQGQEREKGKEAGSHDDGFGEPDSQGQIW